MADTRSIEVAKVEISGTPSAVETGAFKDGRALLRQHFPEHVVVTILDAKQLADLIANLQKALVLLEAQVARKN